MGRPDSFPSAEWQRLVSDYEAAMHGRGLAFRTISGYSDALRRVLIGYCDRVGVQPRDLTRRHLEALSAELLAAGRSRQSVRTYLTAINSFLGWCKSEGELGELVAPRPSVERKVLDVLGRQEIQRLEDAAGHERDKLIVRVLADTGIRLGELRRLRVDDLVIQGRERFLRVRGKGRRDRLVPLTPSLYSRLDRFVRRSRPDAGTDALFVTLGRRRAGDYAAMGESTIEGLITMLGRKANIGKRVHAHLLRHSLATHLLRRGQNPIVVRDILGHTSLAMIDRVYSHLTQSDAHRALMEALRAEDD